MRVSHFAKDWRWTSRMDARWNEAVQILDNLFNPQLDRLQRSLGHTAERQGLLMNNLANVNTPGFKRQDMDFSIVLDEAQGGSPRLKQWRDRAQADFGGAGSSSVRVDGSSVDLEHEVMAIAETDLRYQALTDLTSRYFAGLRNVIREGR